MEIRKANLNDADIISPLFDAYRVFYKQTPRLDASADFLKERLIRNESVIFIAFSAGEVCGFVQLFPIFSSVQLRRAWLLNDLYVVEKFRKKGVATGLLEASKKFASENDSAWLLLQTAADNVTAQSLYEKNGWTKEADCFYTFSCSR